MNSKVLITQVSANFYRTLGGDSPRIVISVIPQVGSKFSASVSGNSGEMGIEVPAVAEMFEKLAAELRKRPTTFEWEL